MAQAEREGATGEQSGTRSIHDRERRNQLSYERKGQSELHEQWRMFDALLSHIPDHAYVLDLDCRFVYANRSLLSTWNKPTEEFLGKRPSEVGIPSNIADSVYRDVREVIATREMVRHEVSFDDNNGQAQFWEYILSPIFDHRGEIEAIAGSSRDVADRKRAEAQERERQTALLESARLESLGIMAGGIAHDFNNLLTGILGNASLLTEDASECNRSAACDIVLAAQRAADLTKQLLAYSGRGRFETEVVDINALIQENFQLVKTSLSSTVTVHLDFAAEACLVEGDRSQIQQVVMNLLINASEAIGNRPGQVSIRTAVTEIQRARISSHLQSPVDPGRFTLIEVSDDGSGMTPETLKRIFDPFFTTKFTGRGLGLAAVLGIVKGHRGDLEVESKVGAGTTFRVLLPFSDHPVEPIQIREVVSIVPNGETILIVDDEEVVRRAACMALESCGFRVMLAADGSAALETLKGDRAFSAVVLDLNMPVMTGEQAIPLIQSARPNLPIILSSGFSEFEVSKRFASSGIAGFLQKPYNPAAIQSKVILAMNGSSLYRVADGTAAAATPNIDPV